MTMEEEGSREERSDPRWCRNSVGRIGEFGVIGAEQADETYLDTRGLLDACNEEEDDCAEPYGADGRIQFSTRQLYGRKKELAQLQAMWDRMMQQQDEEQDEQRFPPVALIAGYSGSGKSSLVEEFVRQLPPGGLFLTAKFTQQELSSGPFGAFGTLFDHLSEETRLSLQKSQDKILENMGDDATILGKIFPGLTQFFLPETDRGRSDASASGSSSGPLWKQDCAGSISDCNSSVGDMSASMSTPARNYNSRRKKLTKERVMFVVQYFFETICTKQRPLVLFLDDLQWLDEQSLQLIQSLLTDPKLPHLFFVGAYRDNEIDDDHKVMAAFKEIEATTNTTIPPTLHLKDLSLECVGQFIADSLQFDNPKDVEPLAQAIFSKTLGNPLFTRQAMEQLVRKNALYYDTIAFCWNWNLRKEQLEELISDDIVAMVRSKISYLSDELQHVLQVASWIRSSFDVETLLEVLEPELAAIHTHSVLLPGETIPTEEEYQTKKTELLQVLYQAVSEGLLVQSLLDPDEFSFAHDRIEEAARSFSQENGSEEKQQEHQGFLAQVGKSLFVRAYSPHGADWMYFSAAKHLNQLPPGTHITPLELVRLNRRTAELSLELLAFKSAVEFCRVGIANLPAESDKVWDTHYDLVLSLYTIAAEAEYGAGNVTQAGQYCEVIVKQKPRSVYDFLPAYKVHLDVLSGQGDEAKEKGYRESFSILEKLGFSFPKGKKFQRMMAWAALKNVKARYIPTETSIQELPQVSDPMLIETFDILTTAGGFAYQNENVPLYALVFCEAVKWISKNGLTEGSAGAIASFTNVLMHQYNDFETSPRLAELAVMVALRLKKKFYEPKALNTANAYVLGWVRPLSTCLPHHKRALESGLTSGNIDGVGVSVFFISMNMMYAGCLTEVDSFCRTRVPQLRKMGIPFFANLTAPCWQAAMNLMGRSNSNSVLTGEAMDETSEEYAKMPVSIIVGIWKRWLCIFCGDWEEGAKSAFEAGDSFPKAFPGLMFGMEPVARCLLLFGRIRRRYDTKYKKAAQQLLKQLKELVTKGCVNLEGPTKLLEAEQYAMLSKKKKARSAFETAISICHEAHLHQFAGLANERFAMYLLEIKEDKGAQKHVSEAMDCYRRWGAMGKVEALQRQLLSLSMNSDTEQMVD